MANKLKQAKIDEMWAAFQEKQSDRYVARMCHVSKNTARNYRLKEKWDERLTKIQKEAKKKADSTAAKWLASNLKLLSVAKQVYTNLLIGKAIVKCESCGANIEVAMPKLRPKFRDIDTLIRLEMDLLGEGKLEEKPKLIKWSIRPPQIIAK